MNMGSKIIDKRKTLKVEQVEELLTSTVCAMYLSGGGDHLRCVEGVQRCRSLYSFDAQ